MQILKSKLKDWVNSPIADIVKTVLERELEQVYEDRADLFISGEPIKTQELRANRIGQELILEDILSLLRLDQDILTKYFELNEVLIVDDMEKEIDDE